MTTELLDRAAFESACRRGANRVQLEGDIVQATVFGKWPILVDQRDRSLARWLITTGFWESWITIAIMRRLQPSWHCVDVGANFGYYTLLLAHRTAGVVAVEPNPDLAALLKRTLDLNMLENCVVVDAAAWNKHGRTLRLTVPGDHMGGATVKGNPTPESFYCRTVEIDKVMHGRGRVDFIKIDAEGAEPEIWEGMEQTLAEYSPIVLMEFTPSAYADPAGFLRTIEAAGYPLATIDGASRILPLTAEQLLASKADLTMLWLEKP